MEPPDDMIDYQSHHYWQIRCKSCSTFEEEVAWLQVLPPLCRTERAAVCRSGPERCGPGAGGEGLPGPGPAAHPPQGADDGDPGVSAADGQPPTRTGPNRTPSPFNQQQG